MPNLYNYIQYMHAYVLINNNLFSIFYLNIEVTAVEISHEFNTNPPHSFHIVRLIRIIIIS